jgi:N-acyl-D-amino-acid deacylase
MKRATFILCAIALFCCGADQSTQPANQRTSNQPADKSNAPFDLIIRHCRIVDGTGNAWFYADLAVRDGKIASIGDLSSSAAAKEIDATGLIVAPGFIDVHTHADTDLYKQPQAENFVRDGVTSIVTGNCGYGARDVGEYFRRLREKGVAINVATLIGHNSILKSVKGDKRGELTAEQMRQAKEMVAGAMRDGAVGMSTGLIYTPGEWSSTEEIIELQKVAAGFGGIYASHMRSESTEIFAAIDEALRVGREAKCRVEISHFKLPADVSSRIGGSDATLKKVLDARAAGQEVWLDQYPYTASSTSISTMLPDWVLEKGADEARKILTSPQGVARVLAEMKQSHEVNRHRKSLAYAVVASCRAYPQYNGRNIEEIARLIKIGRTTGELMQNTPVSTRASDADKSAPTSAAASAASPSTQPDAPSVTMADQYRAIIDIYLHGGASCVFHSMGEPDVENIMRCPLIAIASDSGVREFGVGKPHPRGYGTNTRVLGHYSRELGVIPMEEAVRKMTSLPAAAFRFRDRGLLREGFAADMTIFDPQTVIDRATYEDPHQYPSGIVHVMVNGKLVLEAGEMTGALPGVPLLGPGVNKSGTKAADPKDAGATDPGEKDPAAPAAAKS